MLLATSLITAHSFLSLSWDEWGSIVIILSTIVAIIHWALNKANMELFVPIYEELKKINEHNKRTDDRQDKIDLRAEEHDKELIHHDEKLADHEHRITNLEERQ